MTKNMKYLKLVYLRKVYQFICEWIIDHCISPIFGLLPVKNTILLESSPDLSDSTKAVFDEMIRRKMNEKYKFVWYLHHNIVNPPQIKNVDYLCNKRGRLVFKYFEYTSICLISSNMFLGAHSKGQKAFYINHGSPFKSVKGYYSVPDNVDYLLTASKIMGELLTYEMDTDIKKEVHLGLPRNDAFGRERSEIEKLFTISYKKIIAWFPTYRQHKTGHRTASSNALPIIHDRKAAVRLNDFVKERDVLIVLKPHFAQDLEYIKDMYLSNIILIDDLFFEKNGLSSYEFLNSVDALVSDYSSVYYDYLLCDRPVALIWEDIEEYRSDPGFALDIDYFSKGAYKIYTVSEFENFILDVVNNNDTFSQERKEICDIANYSRDRKNSKRVVDFICQKANL